LGGSESGPPGFSIVREWEKGPNGAIRLVFKVTNNGTDSLEVGGLGIAMPFAWRPGSAAGDLASTFADPAITGKHGYVTVTRLSGKREVLIISTGVDAARCSAGKPGCRTSLEAWDGAAPAPKVAGGAAGALGVGGPAGGVEWLCHTAAYAADWANASKPWLPATSLVLKPGEARDYVLLFSVADGVRSKDAALTAATSRWSTACPATSSGRTWRRPSYSSGHPPRGDQAPERHLRHTGPAVGRAHRRGGGGWLGQRACPAGRGRPAASHAGVLGQERAGHQLPDTAGP
jgi:hypothetical protein